MVLDFCENVAAIHALNCDFPIVYQITGYIREHIGDKISAKEIAEKLNYNRTYLCHIFKIRTGKSLSRYINEVKTEQAMLLLRTTEKSCTEIASSVGFASQNYFNSVFKKITGVSPKEYRNGI